MGEMARMGSVGGYTTRALSAEAWEDFSALVEANGGAWVAAGVSGFMMKGLARHLTALNLTALRSGPR